MSVQNVRTLPLVIHYTIFQNLDSNSIIAAQRSCQYFRLLPSKLVSMGKLIFHSPEKPINAATALSLAQNYQFRKLHLVEKDNDLLLRLIKKIGKEILYLDLQHMRVTSDCLNALAPHLTRLEELVINDRDPQIVETPYLQALTQRMPIKALHLKIFNFNSFSLGDTESVKKIPIKSISFQNRLNATALAYFYTIADKLPQLEKFSFFIQELPSRNIRVLTKMLGNFSQLKKLSIRILNSNGDLRDVNFEHNYKDLQSDFSRLEHIESLSLTYYKYNINFLPAFQSLRLKNLHLVDLNTRIMQVGKNAIGYLQNHSLQKINLKSVEIDESLLQGLSRFPLSVLKLDNCRIAGIGFKHFSRHRYLRELELSNSTISDEASLKELSSTHLEQLSVQNTGVKLSSLGPLSTHLRELDIRGCHADDVSSLPGAQLTSIKIHIYYFSSSFYRNPLPHLPNTPKELLTALSTIPHLTSATFKIPNEKLSTSTWDQISQLRIEQLTWKGVITNEVLRKLSAMKHLKNLNHEDSLQSIVSSEALPFLKHFWDLPPHLKKFVTADVSTKKHKEVR